METCLLKPYHTDGEAQRGVFPSKTTSWGWVDPPIKARAVYKGYFLLHHKAAINQTQKGTLLLENIRVEHTLG